MSEVASLLTPDVYIIGQDKSLQFVIDSKQNYSNNLENISSLVGAGAVYRNIDGSFSLETVSGGSITLTGEASGSGTSSVSVTLSNNAVISKLLTGLSAGSNTSILSTDSILNAFAKTQAQLDQKQPLDSDLTSIASLSTTSYGRDFLIQADASAARTYISAASSTHSHGNISSTGAIGSTANLPLITTTSGVVTVGSFGTAANTFCQGNDSRLSDARTPLAHNQAWSTITSTPTTLSGYGITNALALSGGTLTGSLILPAATTSLTPLRIPHGTAPTSPTNGDIWTTTSGIFVRVNGTTIGPLSAGGGSSIYDHPGYFNGSWYQVTRGRLGAGTALSANTIRLIPFYISADIVVSNIGARITTASSGNNIQLAIYANDATYNIPIGSPIASTANISTTSTGLISVTRSGGGTFNLTRGFYWAAVNSNNSVVAMQTVVGDCPIASFMMGSGSQASVSGDSTCGTYVLSIGQTFGTWPDLTNASFTEINTSSTVTGSCMIHLLTSGARPVPPV